MRIHILSIVVALAAGLPSFAGDEAATTEASAARDAGKRPRYGPRDVEVRLQDGSVIRGEIQGVEAVALKTDYGLLNFPVTRILHINRG
ncbi:MAG: hypothetical protein NTW87_35590, partial [Planctomycetota bacterium]|nr:hypothetical protein [Planctomycetota bacterium]